LGNFLRNRRRRRRLFALTDAAFSLAFGAVADGVVQNSLSPSNGNPLQGPRMQRKHWQARVTRKFVHSVHQHQARRVGAGRHG
jgi:hypothetical protein